jgi:hypothetical protein
MNEKIINQIGEMMAQFGFRFDNKAHLNYFCD